MNGNASTQRGVGTGPVTGEGQLWALLQDLVEREGRDAAALRLGLSERTIRRTLAERHLSRRMTDALLRERDRRHAEQGEEPQKDEQPEDEVEAGDGPLEHLERRLAALETGLKEWGEMVNHQLGDLERRLRTLAQKPEQGSASGPGVSWGGRHRPRMFPALITVEPAADDPQNYRESLPLVAKWRRTLADLQEAPHTLAWLRLQERLIALEIQLLDDHQLTLPPADYPWDGIRRHDELRLRRRVLETLRRRRRWTQVLHGLARFATLGLWGRAPSLERQLLRELRSRQVSLLPVPAQPGGAEDEDGEEGGG